MVIKMKKKLTVVLIAVLAMVCMLAGCGKDAEQESKVTPTFMYFVSNSDSDFDATQKAVEELQDEYDKKVNFDIINIDENPEATTNFPVQGNTPMLIMLNTDNDISAMSPQCSDKDKLKAAIDAALE